MNVESAATRIERRCKHSSATFVVTGTFTIDIFVILPDSKVTGSEFSHESTLAGVARDRFAHCTLDPCNLVLVLMVFKRVSGCIYVNRSNCRGSLLSMHRRVLTSKAGKATYLTSSIDSPSSTAEYAVTSRRNSNPEICGCTHSTENHAGAYDVIRAAAAHGLDLSLVLTGRLNFSILPSGEPVNSSR